MNKIDEKEYNKLKKRYESLKTEYRELRSGVNTIFDRYFEGGDNYDPNYSPTNALDDIYSWFN